MNVIDKLKAGGVTTEEAFEIFDSLEPVEISFMLGNWKGESFPTNHPLDGILEAYRWYGKRFESQEEVHPLVFSTLSDKLVSLNPAFMGSSLNGIDRKPVRSNPFMERLFHTIMPLLATSDSSARLRMSEYRGKSSATMIYDKLPINDVFRKLDDDAVLGIMDLKGMKTPFFFILRRLG